MVPDTVEEVNKQNEYYLYYSTNGVLVSYILGFFRGIHKVNRCGAGHNSIACFANQNVA